MFAGVTPFERVVETNCIQKIKSVLGVDRKFVIGGWPLQDRCGPSGIINSLQKAAKLFLVHVRGVGPSIIVVGVIQVVVAGWQVDFVGHQDCFTPVQCGETANHQQE